MKFMPLSGWAAVGATDRPLGARKEPSVPSNQSMDPASSTGTPASSLVSEAGQPTDVASCVDVDPSRVDEPVDASGCVEAVARVPSAPHPLPTVRRANPPTVQA